MLKSRGCGIIYISHKMEEILRISDDVTIMRDGTWVATKPASELTMNEIIKLMVGRELTNRYPPKDNVIGDVLFEAEGLSSVYENLKDASFKAHKGEILGIAGLDGSGRTELLENIFGLATRHGGTMTLNGKRIRNRNPRESIKNGFAMLTEERRATGIFGYLISVKTRPFQVLKMPHRSLPQQGKDEEEHRLVHKRDACKNSQSGDKDQVAVGR